jgi:hypothetical protein
MKDDESPGQSIDTKIQTRPIPTKRKMRLRTKAVILLLLSIGVMLLIGVVRVYEQRYMLANEIVHFVESQTLPDRCGWNGEKGGVAEEYGIPCLERNGYRFLRAIADCNDPDFIRVIKLSPKDPKRPMVPNIVLSREMHWYGQYFIAESRKNLRELMRLVPEIYRESHEIRPWIVSRKHKCAQH